MSYLHAHPGIRQKIGDKIYSIIYMHSTKEGAEKSIRIIKDEGKYKEVILYPRIIDGKLFGKQPWCVAIRGRK